MNDPIEQFRAAILAAGLTPPDEIHGDGKLHRFSTDGRRNKKNGWYFLHLDGIPWGEAGSWDVNGGDPVCHWCSKSTTEMTEAERDAQRQRIKAMQAEREAELIERQQQAAQTAAARWQAASPATEHPYLSAKGVKPYGVRVESDGFLIVPMRDADGKLWNIERINPMDSTDKKGLTGGRRKGCYHSIGGKPDGVLIVGEGYATCASIHEATGQAVAVAFNAGNLLEVAQALRGKYPALKIVIAADDDWKTQGNPGITKATEAARAVGGYMAVPVFEGVRLEKATDFNDLHALAGLDAVKAGIESAVLLTTETFPALPEAGAVWSEPVPLVSSIAPEPYPLEVFPVTIREAVEEVQAFAQAPVAMVATSALSSLSLAAQALFDIKRAERLTGPIGLFTLVIADSGERKTTCDEFFMPAIRKWQQAQEEAMRPALERYEADMDAWSAEREGLLSAIKQAARNPGKVSIDALKRELANLQADKPEPPRVPRLIYSDITPEELGYQLAKRWPSAAIASSEAGAVLGSHGMTGESAMRNMARLNDLWSGQEIQSDRRTVESWKARCARLTVGLQVQESTLRSFFDKSAGLARGTGFLARFLVAWPESTQGTRMFRDAPASWPNLGRYHQAIERILSIPLAMDEDGALSPAMMALTVEAKAAWVAYHDEVEKRLSAGGDFYDVKDVASKSADNAARLAALFHIFEHGSGAVSLDAMEAGCMVAAWHLHESRRFFGEVALPNDLSDAMRVIRWAVEYCRAQGGSEVATRDLQRLGPVRNKDRLDAALRELQDHHHIRLRIEGKRKLVEINPGLWEATAP